MPASKHAKAMCVDVNTEWASTISLRIRLAYKSNKQNFSCGQISVIGRAESGWSSEGISVQMVTVITYMHNAH